MFLKRSYKKEIMDDFSITDSRIDNALNELKLVNRFLGGVSTSKTGFEILFNNSNYETIKVLDIGSGSSDIFQSLINKLPNLKIFSLDRNKRICEIIKNENRAYPIFGDAITHPVKEESISVVHASLFLHHFNEDEIKKIIKSSLAIAEKGMVINDLRRSIRALIGIKTLIYLFSGSSMVKNDAPLSVKRGFVKSELINLLEELKITNYKIKRKWAFRWLIVIPKNYL
ncbi:MAG: methyltransferase domain-containing protein [Ignavibacteriaceae bacterium]